MLANPKGVYYLSILRFKPLRIYLSTITEVKFVTVVKFHYRVLERTTFFSNNQSDILEGQHKFIFLAKFTLIIVTKLLSKTIKY